MKINLPPDIKVIALPGGMLACLVVLSLLFVNLGLNRFFFQQKDVSQIQKDIVILQEKDTLLRNISTNINQSASLFSFALPNTDPSSMVISQVKSAAFANGVLLESVSTRPNAKAEGLPQVNISLSLKGPVASIFSFLNALSKVAPLISLKNVSLSQDITGESAAEVSLSSYWATFPTTIPASSDSMETLTAEEKDLITQISALTLPTILDLSPQIPSDSRVSPF